MRYCKRAVVLLQEQHTDLITKQKDCAGCSSKERIKALKEKFFCIFALNTLLNADYEEKTLRN